jgi:hypothetical protein
MASPDRQLLIYLRPKPGSLAGQTWTISKEMRGAVVPQVSTLIKTDPRYAPRRKNVNSGYAMKLEFSEADEESVAGRIFVALPDAEQSVVAGVFRASTMLPDEYATPMPVGRVRTPMAGEVTPEERGGIVY